MRKRRSTVRSLRLELATANAQIRAGLAREQETQKVNERLQHDVRTLQRQHEVLNEDKLRAQADTSLWEKTIGPEIEKISEQWWARVGHQNAWLTVWKGRRAIGVPDLAFWAMHYHHRLSATKVDHPGIAGWRSPAAFRVLIGGGEAAIVPMSWCGYSGDALTVEGLLDPNDIHHPWGKR